jgi:hypothetical protein
MTVSVSDFHEKNRMLDDYRLINQQVATSFNITYIGMFFFIYGSLVHFSSMENNFCNPNSV